MELPRRDWGREGWLELLLLLRERGEKGLGMVNLPEVAEPGRLERELVESFLLLRAKGSYGSSWEGLGLRKGSGPKGARLGPRKGSRSGGSEPFDDLASGKANGSLD